MSRIPAVRPLALALGMATHALANESPELLEIRALKAQVEQQSKQLDVISKQLSQLRSSGNVKESAPPPDLSPAAAAPPAAAVAPSALLETAKTTEAPRALPADSNKHVVAKGETLTSIAKHYNIGVSELQKGNKIEDDRKLQIGQTLIIPSKSPEPEKKENP